MGLPERFLSEVFPTEESGLAQSQLAKGERAGTWCSHPSAASRHALGHKLCFGGEGGLVSKPSSLHLGSCPEHQGGPSVGFGRVCAQATLTA